MAIKIEISGFDKDFLPVFESLAKSINAKCKISKPKLSSFESKILNASKELDKEKKVNTALSFNSHQDFVKAYQNGKI
ncbi:TPA: hypothetical protein LGC97_001937 [Campylobacter jejuni]|nr:hypothetical protein [Campylobacter jejuni]